jgi:hypothetical protein
MVYTIHSMLYHTICYARHTTVYIIGIYHGILNDIHIRIYHNISFSYISHSILVPSSPPGAALFSSLSPLQRLKFSELLSCELR